MTFSGDLVPQPMTLPAIPDHQEVGHTQATPLLPLPRPPFLQTVTSLASTVLSLAPVGPLQTDLQTKSPVLAVFQVMFYILVVVSYSFIY